jgi:outer membrane usher protein FimD/PapC
MIGIRGLVAAALFVAMPVRVAAQTEATHGSLRLEVIGMPQGSTVLVRMKDGKVQPQRLAGVAVLRDGTTIGTTSDSGTVILNGLPEGRVELLIRAKDHQDLRCRIRVRADAQQRVEVQLLPEKGVAVWTSYGCKMRG